MYACVHVCICGNMSHIFSSVSSVPSKTLNQVTLDFIHMEEVLGAKQKCESFLRQLLGSTECESVRDVVHLE